MEIAKIESHPLPTMMKFIHSQSLSAIMLRFKALYILSRLGRVLDKAVPPFLTPHGRGFEFEIVLSICSSEKSERTGGGVMGAKAPMSS